MRHNDFKGMIGLMVAMFFLGIAWPLIIDGFLTMIIILFVGFDE